MAASFISFIAMSGGVLRAGMPRVSLPVWKDAGQKRVEGALVIGLVTGNSILLQARLWCLAQAVMTVVKPPAAV